MERYDNMTTPEPRFDVVIIERSTRKVEEIIGTDMRREGRYQSAQSLSSLMVGRLGPDYRTLIVPTGAYRVGAKMSDAE
jgi:hypothetical protein